MLNSFLLWAKLMPMLLSYTFSLANGSHENLFNNSERNESKSLLFLSENKSGQQLFNSSLTVQGGASPNVKKYYDSSERKFEQKDYVGAQIDLDRVIKLDPNHAQAYKNRGGVKVLLKDYPGALSDYNRAIQLDPAFVNAYNGRGFLKMVALNDYQGALSDLNRAIKIKPDSVDAYSNLAILKYVYLKDQSGGINDLQKVIKIFQQQGEQKRAANAARTLNEWRLAAKKAGII
jgi:tetratricopeptide (TPR) repeat protein